MTGFHFKRPPVGSTIGLVDRAPVEKIKTGQRAVVEVVGYPDGQFRLSTSTIVGPPGSRQIKQAETLMFNDADEAKDALDLLLDRIDTLRGTQPSSSSAPSSQ